MRRGIRRQEDAAREMTAAAEPGATSLWRRRRRARAAQCRVGDLVVSRAQHQTYAWAFHDGAADAHDAARDAAGVAGLTVAIDGCRRRDMKHLPTSSAALPALMPPANHQMRYA